MQSFHAGEWRPMEDGAAAHVWQPRPALIAAVTRCREWAGCGGVCIPAMQVVDLETGLVWWRSRSYENKAWPAVMYGEPDTAEPQVEHEQGALF
jgi:hypothetical protein